MLYLKNKRHVITVRLSDSDFFRLKSYSIKYRVSISSLIRKLIASSWL